jgi:hypothetical protein
MSCGASILLACLMLWMPADILYDIPSLDEGINIFLPEAGMGKNSLAEPHFFIALAPASGNAATADKLL